MEQNRVNNNYHLEKMNWEFWITRSEEYKYFCSTVIGNSPLGKDLQMVGVNYGKFIRVPFASQRIIYWGFMDPRGHKFFVRDFDASIIKREKTPWSL